MSDFFSQSEILSVLQGFNPWWRERSSEPPAFRRIAFQVCRGFLSEEKLRRAILLSGPRRVGKTTILIQIAHALRDEGHAPKGICYLSLDHPLLKLVPLLDVLRIYHENIHPAGRPVTLLLDEVQYAEQWELHLKQLIDHRPEYRILATGSASVAHRQKLSESGVGRWVRVPIPTLSFYEFLQIRGEQTSGIPADLRPSALFDMSEGELAGLGAAFRPLMPLFQRYLLVGGFPETAAIEDISLSQRLLREDVVERVLKRDITAMFGIRNVADLEKLFIYICIHSGDILAVKTCADALETTTSTVANHLSVLEQANLIYRLAPYATGGKKVLKSRHKVYLIDAALRNAVLLKREEILENATDMGTIVETTILRHLYAYYYRDTPQVLYWRNTASDREVDMIVRSPRYTIPVEVKYRRSAELDAKQGLAVFCEQEQIPYAYWVTQRERDFAVTTLGGRPTRFLKIPAHIFAYLLGQAERLLWRH